MLLTREDVEVTPEALAAFRRECFDKLKADGRLDAGLRYESWKIDTEVLRRAYCQVEIERAFDAVFDVNPQGFTAGWWTSERAAQRQQARNKEQHNAY